MATVHCTVNNCRFWGQNNYCRAEEILITGAKSPLPSVNQFGVGGEILQGTPVRTQQDSLCYTLEMTNR